MAAPRNTCRFAAFALGTLLIASIGLACNTVGAPPTVPVEVVTVSATDGGRPSPLAIRPPTVEDRNRCESRATLSGRIRTGASCQLDEQISKGPGRLRHPCSGDGPVELEVGTQRFSGSLVGGKVALELTTELDWDDGCHWETHQTVTGLMRGSTLRWSYTEKPVRGQGCFAACTASADLKVTTGSAPPEDADDDEP